MLDAAVAFFQADIKDNIAVFRAKVAKNERFEAYVQVRCALGTHAGVFPAEDEAIDVSRLVVVRNGRDEEQAKARKLVDLSLALTESDDPVEAISGTQLPGSLRENDSVKAFLADLVEFIAANGDRGRDLVSRVCGDEDVARRVRSDDDMPKPLRFLAGLALDVNLKAIKLPAAHRPVGFGAVSETE